MIDKEPEMVLDVDTHGDSVTLTLGCESDGEYAEWINGEGADICILRDRKTNRVLGVTLPLYTKQWSVMCAGDRITVDTDGLIVRERLSDKGGLVDE